MNKKILIAGVLATGLCLSACSDKNETKTENTPAAEQKTQEQVASEKFQPLEKQNTEAPKLAVSEAKPTQSTEMVMAEDDTPPPPRPERPKPVVRHQTQETKVTHNNDVQREETTNTTTEIRRHTKTTDQSASVTPKEDKTPSTPVATETPKATVQKVKAETTEKPSKKANYTQDDAVAAAMAAAKPAL